MVERKLYLFEADGSRYEITIEELKEMAYSGKISRDDKILLTETKNGATKEIETVCGKVKMAAEEFARGEADMKAELDLATAQREAEENARIVQENKEAAEYFKRRSRRESAKNNRRFDLEEQRFEPARHGINKAVAIVKSLIFSFVVVSLLSSLTAIYYEAYCEAHDQAVEGVYEEAYSKAYGESVDKYLKKVARTGNDSEDDQRFALIEAEAVGRQAGDEAKEKDGPEAGKKAGKKAGIKAVLIWAPILAFFSCLFAWSLIVLTRSVLTIPLLIATCQTEALESIIARAVENNQGSSY